MVDFREDEEIGGGRRGGEEEEEEGEEEKTAESPIAQSFHSGLQPSLPQPYPMEEPGTAGEPLGSKGSKDASLVQDRIQPSFKQQAFW